MNKKLFLFEGLLQIFIAVGALGGGLVLLIDPSGQGMGFSVELLSGSPFSSYLIPGLVLFAVIGIGNFTAAFLSFRKHRIAGLAAILLGGFLAAWILIQVWIVGWLIWLQPSMLALGVLELVLGFFMHRR